MPHIKAFYMLGDYWLLHHYLVKMKLSKSYYGTKLILGYVIRIITFNPKEGWLTRHVVQVYVATMEWGES